MVRKVRTTFSAEFKPEVVRLLEQGDRTPNEIARLRKELEAVKLERDI